MKYCIICRDNDRSDEIKKEIIGKVIHEYDEKSPELVIAVGGDGTILRASHQFPDAIIFGIHTGHLGFYANYSINDLDVLIDDINNGSYKIDYLDLLTGEVTDEDGNVFVDNAMNEITVVCPLKVLLLDVFIDNDYFERYRGTGLCISTPYGSTAYNKSLAGSVIDPELKVIQITEIAGINSNAYRTLSSPLVLSSRREIRLESSTPIELYVTVDHNSYLIKSFKKLVIKYNSQSLKMGYHSHQDFINRINRTFLLPKE